MKKFSVIKLLGAIEVMKSWYTLWIATVLVTVGGCVSPSTGLLAAKYAENKYPVSAAVHGIEKTRFAEDLHEIVTTYTPAREIERNTNTTHGWLIHIEPAKKPIMVREVYVLPGPARWGTKERPVSGRVVRDRTTCVTEWAAGKGAKYIGNSWGMFSDDPLGEYRLTVFVDDRLAAEFKFRVIPEPRQVPP